MLLLRTEMFKMAWLPSQMCTAEMDATVYCLLLR